MKGRDIPPTDVLVKVDESDAAIVRRMIATQPDANLLAAMLGIEQP